MPQKIAVGYCRVSSEGQVKDGVSLEAQRSKIENWTKLNGYELAQIHVDAGLSGGRADNRPALQKALTQVIENQGVLVVYSLSRLARSTRDTIQISERLEKAGVDLASISEKIDTTNAAGKMVFRLLAVLAEFERDLISERTKSAMAYLKSKNQRVGAVPFGFTLAHDQKTIEKNPSEGKVIKIILSLRDKGLTLQQIASRLESENIPCRKAKIWYPKTVANIVERNQGLTIRE